MTGGNDMAAKKRHWALAGLVLALGTAVYLNWQFSPEKIYTKPESVSVDETYKADEMLGDAAAVDAHPASMTDAVGASTKEDTIEKLRADRTASRQQSEATLKDIIDDASLSDSEKASAVNTAAQLAENAEKESSVETLIKAKGFSDCLVIISDTQINVVIPHSDKGIDGAVTAMIQDVVMGQTDFSPSAIKIIEAK